MINDIKELKKSDRVCIVGCAPSWIEAYSHPKEFEIDMWGINELYIAVNNKKLSMDVFTGWFEIHNIKESPSKQVPSHQKFLKELKDNMEEPNISEQEIKLGQALSDIFTNYGSIFQETSNNNKFNKNIILFELREMTNLSTKEIRNSLKRYKKIYFHIVNELLK